jgi:hypothetical protein
MPYLIYQTVGDSRVRASHKALDGIKRPIDDDFWKTYYPPNDWNCRCTVNQTGNGDPTPDKRVPSITIPAIFQTNLAQQGLLFPKDHPYYTDVPQQVLRRGLTYLPADAAYIRHDLDNGSADIHLLHAPDNDSGIAEIKRHMEITNDLYALGYKDAKLLPVLYDNELKAKFYPNNYIPVDLNKNPDALISSTSGKKMVCDYKFITGSGRTMGEHITTGAKQSEFVVVKLANPNHRVSKKSAATLAKEKMEKHPSLKGVVIINHDGKLLHEHIK